MKPTIHSRSLFAEQVKSVKLCLVNSEEQESISWKEWSTLQDTKNTRPWKTRIVTIRDNYSPHIGIICRPGCHDNTTEILYRRTEKCEDMKLMKRFPKERVRYIILDLRKYSFLLLLNVLRKTPRNSDITTKFVGLRKMSITRLKGSSITRAEHRW